VLPGDVIDEKGSDGTAVVGASDGPEIFLASCIPDLQFDVFVIDGDGLGAELNSDGDIMSDSGLVLDELQYDARFAHAYSGLYRYLCLQLR
jgi:hypothetical protein